MEFVSPIPSEVLQYRVESETKLGLYFMLNNEQPKNVFTWHKLEIDSNIQTIPIQLQIRT